MARDSFIGQYDSQRSTADPKRWSPILVSNCLVFVQQDSTNVLMMIL